MLYFILRSLSIQTDPYQGLIFIYAIICMNIFIHMIAYMPICIGEMWDVTTVHERTKKVESGAVFSFGRIQGSGGRGYKTIFLAQTEIKNPQNFLTSFWPCVLKLQPDVEPQFRWRFKWKRDRGPGREMRPIKTLWCPPSGRHVAGDFPTGFLWGGDEVFWRDVSIMPKA